jgi:hypothetical protein
MTWEFETTSPGGLTIVLVGTAWPECGDVGYEVDRIDVYSDDDSEPLHTSQNEAVALALLGDEGRTDLHQHIREELADAGVWEPTQGG